MYDSGSEINRRNFHRLVLFLAATAGMAMGVRAEESPRLRHILSCQGDTLYDGDQAFRFISFNIPNLHLVEDNFSFTNPNPWRWPNEFEIEDALESVRQMGGTVVRTYVLSVRREGSDMGEHVHVRGPGEFNEEAFRVLDKVLQIATEKGIRVIIPFVDQWHWWGGRAEYAQFRGKPAEAFWSDEQIITDFEKTIDFVLSRINSCTGIPYKDDPAIFGWETGNELDCPPEWTRRIAAFIKSRDPNHLVIDGYSLHGVREASLTDPNIDVITTHHYPNTDSGFVEPIRQARALSEGKKPYFVGEFGFIPKQEIEEVFDTIIDEGVSGGLLWSLRFHSRDGGFYWHAEPSGGNLFKAYHWPGFPSGDSYEETAVLELTRQNAYRIRGREVPNLASPAPPHLLPIQHPGRISWRGSAGASSYDVQRATNEDGPWALIARDINDAAIPYRPLFDDKTVEKGEHYFYRVIARNGGGVSGPSNVVGPVVVGHFLMVDEMRDDSLPYSYDGPVRRRADQPRKTQEDLHRLELGPGGFVEYRFQESACTVKVFVFCGSANPDFSVSISTDGNTFENVHVKRIATARDAGNYSYLQPVLLQAAIPESGARMVRIRNTSTAQEDTPEAQQAAFQISRVEIAYGCDTAQP